MTTAALLLGPAVDRFVRAVVGSNDWLRLIAIGFVYAAALELLTLPLDFWSGFMLEHRYQLSTQSFAGWVWKRIKSYLVGGTVGLIVLLGLYALLLWRALRVVTVAKNLFGTLIAGGILAMLMFQVFVNVGMTVGIAPITGVPLPLISYGGSSVIVTFIAIGLLESIYIQGRLAASGKNRALIS